MPSIIQCDVAIVGGGLAGGLLALALAKKRPDCDVRLMAGRPLHHFTYHDHGSLVSLSRFSTVGSLMGNLIGGKMAIEGRLARFVYTSLYRMHLIAIHGWWKGLALLAVGRVNAIVRPRLKLH